MFRKVVLASAIALAAAPAQAALFGVNLSWDDGSQTRTLNFNFNQAEDAIDVVDIDFIKEQWKSFGSGTDMDTATALIAYRGVPLVLTYSTNAAGEEEVTLFSDPKKGINIPLKKFSG